MNTIKITAWVVTAVLLGAGAQTLQAQPRTTAPKKVQISAADTEKLARRAARQAAKQAAKKRKELIRQNRFCIHCGKLMEKPGQKCAKTKGKTVCTVTCPDCGKNLRDKTNVNKQGIHHCKFKTRITPAKPVIPEKKPAPKTRGQKPKKK